MKFNKQPICELCEEAEATKFMLNTDGIWSFICEKCEDDYDCLYQSDVIDYVCGSIGQTIDFLVSLDKDKNTLMKWSEFMNMMFRFREATDSFDPWRCCCREYPNETKTKPCGPDCDHPRVMKNIKKMFEVENEF